MTLGILVTATGILLFAVPLYLYGSKERRASPKASRQGNVGEPVNVSESQKILVATYNIYCGKGTDGIQDLSRTADVLNEFDIAALQEVEAGWGRSQVQWLGQYLKKSWIFTPTIRKWFCSVYGNGMLTTLPILNHQSWLLPNYSGIRYRAYTVVELLLGDQVFSILYTHLHTRVGRDEQFDIVLNHFNGLSKPCMLLGDLNVNQSENSLTEKIADDVTDAIAIALGPNQGLRVDWILTRGLNVERGGVTEMGVSDHPCFWVEVSAQ